MTCKDHKITRGSIYYTENNGFENIVNELPEQYRNNIIIGDSEIILRDLPDNCIDLIVTSPPYNFGLEYDTINDSVYWKEYFNKLFIVFNECIRVLKYGGRIIVNIQPSFSDYVPSHHIISNYFMNKNLFGVVKLFGRRIIIIVSVRHGAVGKAQVTHTLNIPGNFLKYSPRVI